MPIDLPRQRWRSRFEAWVLAKSAPRMHRQYGSRKAEVIGAFAGTVVELGPGVGANMRYFAPGVKVIGIEPNPVMHDRLRSEAAAHGVDYEIRTLRGEQVDLPDSSADAVVATLVLCGVDDPAGVLTEVRRILKPGGMFFFLEHVVAPVGSVTRRVQAVMKRPHRWTFNGCEVDRDTVSLLRTAGFSSLDLDEIDEGAAGAYVRYQIVGTAVR